MAEYQPDEIARLEKLFFSNPEGRVFTHLAEAYRKVGDLGRARQILEDGLRRHEGYASAHVVFGRVLSGLGESDAAMREFRRVLELDPENRIALQSLAEHAQRHGRDDDALQHLRRLGQLDPSDAEVQGAIERLEQATARRAEAAQPPAWEHGYMVESRPAAAEPEPGQHASPEDDPGFQPLDHLLGADLGVPEGAAEGQRDPFAALNGEWTGGYAEPAEPEGAADAHVSGTGGEEWPALDMSDAPALRFDWGLSPAEPAEGARDDAHAAAPGVGDDAAQWLSSVNADWDTPAGLDFAPDRASAPDAEAEPPAPESGAGAAEWPFADVDEGPDRDEASAGPFDPIDGGELLPDAAETEVYTETLADLYRAQGFPERAVGVYRSLLADRPGDERLMQKLREMEGVIDNTQHAAGDLRAAEQWSQVAEDVARAADDEQKAGAQHHSVADAGGVEDLDAAGPAAAESPAEAPELPESVAEDEERGARWIEGIESAWTGGDGAVEDATSPYAWVGGAGDEDEAGGEAAAGPSIRAVLGGLLSWRPTRGAAAEPEEELLLLDELDAESDIAVQLETGTHIDAGRAGGATHDGAPAYVGGADAAADVAADSGRGGDASEREEFGAHAGWQPWQDTSESAAEEESAAAVRGEPAAEESDARAAEVLDEPAAEAPYEPAAEASDEPAAEAADEPAAEVSDEPAAEAPDEPYVPMPWEEETGGSDPWSEASAGEASLGDEAQEAESPRAQGGGGGEESSRHAGSPGLVSEQGSAAGGRQAEDSDEDDDLEMFRSWLQSLKK